VSEQIDGADEPLTVGCPIVLNQVYWSSHPFEGIELTL